MELSREQLTKLLQQVAAAGVSGSEVGHLSDQLFKQLSNGLSPDLVSRKAAAAEARSAAGASAAAHPTPAAVPAPRAAAPQQQQQQQPGSVAAAAAQAAAARSGQRADAVAALESRPRAAAPAAATAGGRPALMPISQSAIAQQAAALRKVEPSAKPPAARQPESGLEAALRKGELVLQMTHHLAGLAHGDEQEDAGVAMATCCAPAMPSIHPCCTSLVAAASHHAGLERFKFEDATAGEEDGNTTGGFSSP